MRSMVEGDMRSMVGGQAWTQRTAPTTAHAAKPAQAAQACLRWAVLLPRYAGEEGYPSSCDYWLSANAPSPGSCLKIRRFC